LPDITDKNGKPMNSTGPSEFAWPEVLGKKLNLSVVNYGKGGASNRYICKEMLDKQLYRNDIVVFMWSYFSRTCFWDDNGNFKRIMPSSADWKKDSRNTRKDKDFCRIYYENFFSYYNSNYESYQQINFAKMYLDTQGIKNYHTTVEVLPFVEDIYNSQLLENKKLANSKLENLFQWNTVDLHHQKLYDNAALDNEHPSVDAHKKIAEDIYKIITEKLIEN
jgi:hypothetical protein